MNREMLAMCSFPFCERSAAVLMQPTFDRGRATWHDAQIRHTMDPPFEARWTGHDLDGCDHDRHHHGWRAPCNEGYRTCQNTRRFLAAHLDPAAPEAGRAILCRVRVQGRGGAGPAPQHHEASHGFCMPAQRWTNTSITTKVWRHEHLNVTLFDETEMEHEGPAARTASIHQCHELFSGTVRFIFDGQACDSAVSPGTLGISTCTSTAHVSRLLQHVPKFPGVKPPSATNVNAWICTCANDSNLEWF